MSNFFTSFWNRPLIITDTETTGLSAFQHEMIELGALRVMVQPSSIIITDTFESKIKPRRIKDASPKALEINGYTKEAWVDAPDIKDAMAEFDNFSNGGVFAAYNVTFDWAFVNAAFGYCQIKPKMDYHRLDIMTLSWLTGITQSHMGMKGVSLKNTCDALGIPPEPDVHRALEGAKAAYRVLEWVIDQQHGFLSGF